MHREILSTMLRASIPYFSKTRSGSIIQRFGRDLHDVISASWLIFNMASRIVTSGFSYIGSRPQDSAAD